MVTSEYSDGSVLHIVHCIDTEGPLTETIQATFERIKSVYGIKLSPSEGTLVKLQKKELDLNGFEGAVARMVAPELLDYNTTYDHIGVMLRDCLSEKYRKEMVDDFGRGWVYSWHCMDHMGYSDNPRKKDVGYGNVFRYYRSMMADLCSGCEDELNWHFHPRSLTGNPLQAATSYTNSAALLTDILCRRIIDDKWFPVVNRPGFHSERPDSHLFLEQWIPFDYANQFHESSDDDPDISSGRFGDWRRSTPSWCGYHPDHDDYQVTGQCRRIIFRCLNVGTRARTLNIEHLHEAFKDAQTNGVAVLAFADHDYRDIRPDVERVRNMLAEVRPAYPNVKIRFSGAEDAAIDTIGVTNKSRLKLEMELSGMVLRIKVTSGQVFGPQPFLAIKGVDGRYYHDNLDFQVPQKEWTYVFDEHTLPLKAISSVGVGGAGRIGGFDVEVLNL